MILHIVAEEYNVAFYYLSFFINNRRRQQVSLSAQHNLWFPTYPSLSLSLSLSLCVCLYELCVWVCVHQLKQRINIEQWLNWHRTTSA